MALFYKNEICIPAKIIFLKLSLKNYCIKLQIKGVPKTMDKCITVDVSFIILKNVVICRNRMIKTICLIHQSKKVFK